MWLVGEYSTCTIVLILSFNTFSSFTKKKRKKSSTWLKRKNFQCTNFKSLVVAASGPIIYCRKPLPCLLAVVLHYAILLFLRAYFFKIIIKWDEVVLLETENASLFFINLDTYKLIKLVFIQYWFGNDNVKYAFNP